MSRFSAREITLVAVFAALNVVAAMVARYGGSIVPFSLIPFMAMLAGGLLGARLGAMSMVVYILLGLAGVPVFATPPLAVLPTCFNPPSVFWWDLRGAPM